MLLKKKEGGRGKRCGETFVSIVKCDEKGKKFRFGNEAAAREQIGRKRRRR